MEKLNIIEIPLLEYVSLLKESAVLRALNEYGVDNWPGCEDAADQITEEWRVIDEQYGEALCS